MIKYIMRLDDASEYMDLHNWMRMEKLLDRYGIKPIFGIIPKNADESIVSKYDYNPEFWNYMHSWIKKGWIPAMHGYEHRYITTEGGLNPVNQRSEFAGLPYEEQALKIREGYKILKNNEINPEIFFAPSHTFDENTLKAIKHETKIRIISDTIAWDIYKENDFYFIPQQSGSVRNIPFKVVTFCYHPNTMDEVTFQKLDWFLEKHSARFLRDIKIKSRRRTIFEKILQKVYLLRH